MSVPLIIKLSMEINEIKRQMKILWKDTFHDSDEYISMIFDNYFKEDLIAYKTENEDTVVSALLGIPYRFRYSGTSVNALYLCGLATKESYRRMGIMDSLLKEINDKSTGRFDFTFLIPASSGLEKYYNDRGYRSAIYRVIERYTSAHDFKKAYYKFLEAQDRMVGNLKKNYFDTLTVREFTKENIKSCISEIIDFITKIETDSTYPILLHSPKDISLIIADNLSSGGRIYVCEDCDSQIKGIAFSISDDEQIIIPKIYSSDNCACLKLLDYVKREYPDSSITLYRFPEEDNQTAVWSKYYIAQVPGTIADTVESTYRVYKASEHSKTYGMVRILNVREILKFATEYQGDVKFSILVNVYDNGILTQKDCGGEEPRYVAARASGRNLEYECIPTNTITEYKKRNPDAIELSLHDLENLLFRKNKEGEDIIMKTMGIPRLPLNMALMLD